MSSPFDKLEAITKQLLEAANSRYVCSVKLSGEDGYRKIHTHGVCMTKKKALEIVCWQQSGFSSKGVVENYKNLPLVKCENVMVLNKKFIKRRDFNPNDPQYGEWLFHI